MTPESVFPCLESAPGRRHPLGKRLTTIGSDAECQVRIDGAGVRPQHAFLVFQMGRWVLRPLEPGARLRVRGKDVAAESEIAHGDAIELGDQALRFLEREEAAPSAESSPPPALAQVLDAVAALLRESSPARVVADIAAAAARLLECDGVRVLHRATGDALWRTLASHPAGAPPGRFSASALRRAESQGGTVRLSESDLAGLPPGESVQLNSIRSLLCAPLPLPDGHEGFLYADRLAGHPPFEASDEALFESLRGLFGEIATIAARSERQRQAIAALQDDAERSHGGAILHGSEPMRRALHEATRLAVADVPVHIFGETGTGKELVARHIHEASRRSAGPFIAINCGAIPENLIESELFGHEKGAFTGAASRRTGWIEAAQGGTLFLDELGELPLAMQVKLLRVLQQGELVRVGSTEPVKVDFRLVTATNRNLKEEVAAGRFRADLFYRVAVVQIDLPPLREREGDAVLLASHFVHRFCRQYGVPDRTLSRAAEKAILAHSWPGNVRELENAVQKAVILSTEDRIRPRDLGLSGDEDDFLPMALTGVEDQSLYAVRDRAERAAIDAALRKSCGNVSLSARILDVDRKVLIRTIERLGLRPEDYKS